MRARRVVFVTSSLFFGSALSGMTALADTPFAIEVVSYAAGSGAAAGFTNPSATLGSPERFTGEVFLPSAVTPFQPAFRPDEIVSIGVGGSLVVRFDHDVLDDARNPFGIDLIVFGNSFFTDVGAGAGVVGGIAAEGGRVFVSADGVQWTAVRGLDADGLFPTLGYLDATPYATVAGQVPSDFTRPVDPSITMGEIAGVGYDALLAAYDGSGGGAGIDIGALGLASVRFVRIDGPTVSGFSPEIDAVADVSPLPPDPDLNGDGSVNAADLAQVLDAWGSADPVADLDASGSVGSSDLAVVLSAWNDGGTP